MSTKVTKKSVTRTYQSSSSSDTSGARVRTPSPARISRLKEKETLTNLNDRLAAYIDKVRSLESENSRLSLQITTFEETNAREVSGVKALYERELADARRLIDELGKEKAKLLIDLGKYKSESEDLAIKYNRKDRECAVLNKKLSDAEARLPELELQVTEGQKERDRLNGDMARLRSELADYERQMAGAKKQLEEETLTRVDLENKIQSLKEELAFKAQLHETQMNETRTRFEYSMDDTDARLDSDYQARLQQALTEFRKEQEVQNRVYREEVELMYEAKVKSLEGELANRGGMSTESRAELSSARDRIQDLQSQVNKLTAQISSLEATIGNLQADLRRERDTSRALLSAKEKEVSDLRAEMDLQLQEYQDLLEIKCSLDMELAAYRKLLESEEDRLKMSPGRTTTTVTASTTKSSSRKRKRVDEEGPAAQLSSSGAFSCVFNSSGNLSISEVEENGKYVKIYNSSNKEASLGGWHLVHKAGDQTTEYKFHRSVKIEPLGYVTVWSSSSDVDQDPDTETDKKHNFTMKGMDFFTAETMRTVLSDGKNKEQATLEMKSASSSSTATAYFTETSRRETMGDPSSTNGDGKTCAIM